MSDDVSSISHLNAALSGRYAVERELGQGGMATVYLAKDLKHHRNVAVKVLRPELAAVVGAERFLAEIEVTANLQHPNILPLFDSGQADGFLFYVMPFVEGETLRERIARERQLPVDEAVRVATEVAEALAHAHGHGVVHRDIKPANILLRDGRPLVADFGIALAVGSAGASRLTETGLLVGTPHYMSPEQATGDSVVGPPSDVYSLACTLYEMLVGTPPYPGTTAQAVLASLIAGDPVAPAEQRPTIPAHVDGAIRRGLEKTPADRFTRPADFARALNDTGFRYGNTQSDPVGGSVKTWRAATIVLGLATAGLAALVVSAGDGGPGPGAVTRFPLDLPVEVGLPANSFGNHLGISPDGRLIAYTGAEDSDQRPGLWLRDLASLQPRALPGTEDGLQPEFAPDGRRIAFIGRDRIVRIVSLQGSAPTALTSDTTINRAGLSWGEDGFIYFSRLADPDGISRIPETGGDPEFVTTVDQARDEVAHYFPDVIPGSDAVIFTVAREATFSPSTRDIAVARISTGEVTVLFQAIQAVWSPTGHILAVLDDGSLLATPFDPRTFEMGPPTTVATGVGVDQLASADFAVSEEGTLVYQRGASLADRGTQPVWLTRDGRVTPVEHDWGGQLFNPRISPNGRHVAYQWSPVDRAVGFIEVRDLEGGTVQRLTREGVLPDFPVWGPGGRVSFLQTEGGPPAVVSRRQDAATTADTVLPPPDLPSVLQRIEYAPDGSFAFVTVSGDIFRWDLGDPPVLEPVLADPNVTETRPALSPNRRWLAYVAVESDGPGVYVSPFPDVTRARIAVSSGPATQPRWARDGSEIFYWERDGRVMAAAIEESSDRLIVGQRTPLFETTGFRYPHYDLHPDGRFLLIRTGDLTEGGSVVVIQNLGEVIEGGR